jgi:hypothetical protein
MILKILYIFRFWPIFRFYPILSYFYSIVFKLNKWLVETTEVAKSQANHVKPNQRRVHPVLGSNPHVGWVEVVESSNPPVEPITRGLEPPICQTKPEWVTATWILPLQNTLTSAVLLAGGLRAASAIKTWCIISLCNRKINSQISRS